MSSSLSYESGIGTFEVNLKPTIIKDHSSSSMSSYTTDPPSTPITVKRRRGRPPKTIESTEENPSPAASSSAAVLKQGSPKASVSLMRVSPLRKSSIGSKNTIRDSSSPLFVLPSPKGGKLMILNESTDVTDKNGKRGRKNGSKKKNNNELNERQRSMVHDTIHKLTSSSELDNNHSNSTTSSIRTSTTVPFSSSSSSAMLLSSPIRSEEGMMSTASLFRSSDNFKTPSKATKRFKPLSVCSSSSPIQSPNPSSCFSSMENSSSPLSTEYYDTFPAVPSSTTTSSSITPQKIKKPRHRSLIDFQKRIEQLNQMQNPKNPTNSPTLKPTTSTKLEQQPPSTFPNYKLSFTVNENGQAILMKTPTVPPLITSTTPSIQKNSPVVPKTPDIKKNEPLFSPSNIFQFNTPIQQSSSDLSMEQKDVMSSLGFTPLINNAIGSHIQNDIFLYSENSSSNPSKKIENSHYIEGSIKSLPSSSSSSSNSMMTGLLSPGTMNSIDALINDSNNVEMMPEFLSYNSQKRVKKIDDKLSINKRRDCGIGLQMNYENGNENMNISQFDARNALSKLQVMINRNK